MILLLDTSTGECRLDLVDGDSVYSHRWQADRTLARQLLAFMRDSLAEHDRTFHDISGIALMLGPGSFTGLRIGITVCNTLANSLFIPIVGTTGSEWQATALQRLASGDNDQIVLPEYGAAANITLPRK